MVQRIFQREIPHLFVIGDTFLGPEILEIQCV